MSARTALDGAFESAFDGSAAGIWAAPGRVNLIGEHTDYNDGYVLPLALPQGVAAAAATRSDDLVRMASRQADGRVEVRLDALKPGAVDGWAAYVAGVVWSLREAGHEVGGLDILVDGDVPLGAGLSSSAALECATALAVTELFGLKVDRTALAGLAQRAENDFVGMPCGIMDQSASLLCTREHLLFLDTRTSATEQVPFDLGAHGLALLVVDTHAPHRLVDGEYAARRRTCEEAAAKLGVRALRDVEGLQAAMDQLGDTVMARRVRHVVTENARVLATVERLRTGSPRDIGPLLTASHESLRDDYEVTVPELDKAVEAALDAGALGARMTGGGFGGCVIALVEADAADTVAERVAGAFAAAGFGAPSSFVAQAGQGARRIR
ncbi:galactokinase [Actinopolymorpha singaporensis]|uniref:Galactokinase n=1 Tax=Actinopolymorpha singaporensis TaxID=117157 RepID=A0A1H1SM49_9ACTN|nr:galactokinase [Actinopolymorpha singaporensis]SDS48459.1 galactokinase [Actinopolymorpha singaporensis]